MAPILVALLLVSPRFVQTAVTLDVGIDYQKHSLRGRATIAVENRGPASNRVSLLLGRLMRVNAVSSAGKPLRFEQETVIFEDEPMLQVVQVRVELPAPVALGGRATVDVDYGGPLVGYTEIGWLYVKDRIDPAFTILRREAYAFPVVGVPSRKANRSLREPDFPFTVTVQVPSDQVVATGGKLVSHAGGKWRFEAAPAPFLNIAIAPYAMHQAGGIRVYALPADAANAAPLLEAARRAMSQLAEWYGPLDREPELSIAEIPEDFGSQASLTGGIIVEKWAFSDVKQRRNLYHELSHIWNAPDLDQPSPRWNEGLATYLELRLARLIDGVGDIDAVAGRTSKRLCEAAAKLKDVPFRQYGEKEMTDWSYSVGFLMFRELEKELGTTALDAALRELFQKHKGSGARTDDLRDALLRHGMPAATWQHWMTTTAWLDSICGPGR